MAHTFYSEFVTHCMRFYSRYPAPRFRTKADKKNWLACDKSLKKFSPEDREILMTIYRERDTIPDNVYEVAKKMNLNQDQIWTMISDLEHRIAKRRGML